ncbi:hypothetical protein KPSA3_00307 [Pseudomonas syringae pv. actinidiae]|uniref:Uncharacterized protein n=1 Tax=Pseudomonas syringae pv. actinidiae TaxID=103796 RepID=A0AAN4PZR1_PSESF|nr:hypothetical protein KPSA3_00307 [Pseudomonas syringae pv. actinidiae]
MLVAGGQIALDLRFAGQTLQPAACVRGLLHQVADQCRADHSDSQQVFGGCASL